MRPACDGRLQALIVVHDQHPVARQMHIEFDPVGAHLDGMGEGLQRVLGPKPRAAAMRDLKWLGHSALPDCLPCAPTYLSRPGKELGRASCRARVCTYV